MHHARFLFICSNNLTKDNHLAYNVRTELNCVRAISDFNLREDVKMPDINLDFTINIGTAEPISIKALGFQTESIDTAALKQTIEQNIARMYGAGVQLNILQNICCEVKLSADQPSNGTKVQSVHSTILLRTINQDVVRTCVITAIESEGIKKQSRIATSTSKLGAPAFRPPPPPPPPPRKVSEPAVRPPPPPPPRNVSPPTVNSNVRSLARRRCAISGIKPYDESSYDESITCSLTLIKTGEKELTSLDILDNNNRLYIYMNLKGQIQFKLEYNDSNKAAISKLLEDPAWLSDHQPGYTPSDLNSLSLDNEDLYLSERDLTVLNRAMTEGYSLDKVSEKTIDAVLGCVSTCIDTYVTRAAKKCDSEAKSTSSNNNATHETQTNAGRAAMKAKRDSFAPIYNAIFKANREAVAGGGKEVEETSSKGKASPPVGDETVGEGVNKTLQTEKRMVAATKIQRRFRSMRYLNKWMRLINGGKALLAEVLAESSHGRSVLIDLPNGVSNNDTLIPIIEWFSLQGIDLNKEMKLPFLGRKGEQAKLTRKCAHKDASTVSTESRSVNCWSSGRMNDDMAIVSIDTPNMRYTQEQITELFLLINRVGIDVSNVHLRAEEETVRIFEVVRAAALDAQQQPFDTSILVGQDETHNPEPASRGFSFAMLLSFMADNPVKTIAGVLVIVAGVTASLMSLGVIPACVAFAGCVAMVASALSVSSGTATGIVGGVALSAAVLTAGAGLYCSLFHQSSNHDAGAPGQDAQLPSNRNSAEA
jgi:hypothetical protein